MRAGPVLAGTELKRWFAAVMVAGLCACAPFGEGIRPGESAAQRIEAELGTPTERVALGNGESVWFWQYRAQRQNYAVRIGADGIARSSVEPRLTTENVGTLRANTMTKKDVRALLGPPFEVARMSIQQREVWTYRRFDYSERRSLHVQFSDDGVVREVLDMMEFGDERRMFLLR